MQIDYIAKRSLKSGHVLDDPYTINVNLSREDRRFIFKGAKAISLLGNTVSTVNRRDEVFDIETVIIQDASTPDNDDMTEFLDSTVAGETFQADPNGVLEDFVIERGQYRKTRVGTTNIFRWSWSMRQVAFVSTIVNASGNDD